MHIEQKVNIHNRFDVEVRDVKTGKLKQKATGLNIVLDQMWTRLCGGYSYFVNIHFGTGTGTLSQSRTSLFTHLGTKTAADEEKIKAIPVSRWKRKIVLNPEEYVGSTITEVGIAFGTATSNLVTHAMLKDAEGNPISIIKTDTDVITIYATVFVTINNTAGITMLGIPSSNQLVNYLVDGATAPTGTFGLLPFIGAYARLGSTATATWTADVQNKKRKTNVSRFGINDGNGPVKAFEFTNLFAVEFPAAGIFTGQPYTDVNVGTGDGVTNTFAIPSKNIIEGTLKLKIDGVETTSFVLSGEDVYIDLASPSGLLNYGYAVDVSKDGKVLAHAAANISPYIKIYDWDGSKWLDRPLIPNYASILYIRSVAISADGTVVAIGTETEIRTFDWNGTEWAERASLPTFSVYRPSVALSADGSVLAVGTGQYTPYIRVYDWTGTVWTERVSPPNLPNRNRAVSLSSNGSVLAVATETTNPFIKVYDWTGTAWTERATPPNLTIAIGLSLSSDGTVLAVATNNESPFVRIYDWTGTVWTERATPPNVQGWGNAVTLNSDGSILAIVVSASSPYVRVYDWTGTVWSQRESLPNTSSYGNSIAISSDASVLAAVSENRGVVLKTYKSDCTKKYFVKVDTPPLTGVAITADYTVNGVHKTSQYVVDVSFAIQFGEGV